MGKHRNTKQDKIFLGFMVANPAMAQRFYKGDRNILEEKWKELANLLNEAGPPTKDILSWKKAWTDWKSTIRKKLCRKQNEERASDSENDDRYGLSKADRTIIDLCDIDLPNQKRGEEEEFICGQSNPIQSPISTPALSPQPTKRRKHNGLRESFLEALTQNSRDDSINNIEIKTEKEDKTDEFFYQTTNHYSIDSSSNCIHTIEKLKCNSHKDVFETKDQHSKDARQEKAKLIGENFENRLCGIEKNLNELGKKYDELIELKKEQIEEMKRSRHEIRRHNLEIEKYNSAMLALKTEKKLKCEKDLA